jgi:DNA (cytosine-5)-methyltransferase 1
MEPRASRLLGSPSAYQLCIPFNRKELPKERGDRRLGTQPVCPERFARCASGDGLRKWGIENHSMTRALRSTTKKRKDTFFIDAFAGCGGLSLGLQNAGWRGRFAIEKNPDAFRTFAKNLIDRPRHSFKWPDWLPKKPTAVRTLLSKYADQLQKLRGKIDLLAGAPPCQGFSLAGRRTHPDPRNTLFRQYLLLVKIVRPRFVLVENVQGFSFPFKKHGKGREKHKPYSELLAEKLEGLGYRVFSELVDFSEYGVPQTRNRFILVAIREGDRALEKLRRETPFHRLRRARKPFLKSKELPVDSPVSTKQAIADLETSGATLVPAPDEGSDGFLQVQYVLRRRGAPFVKLMQRGVRRMPDSLRLPRHRTATVRQFSRIMSTCKRGQSLNGDDRKRLGIKKHALTPLDSKLPSSTITTLPDDILHYSEPRILTVRENARLQTFPDWFEFTGEYTTGGKERRRACPRYTQVGNAVPPLFAEAIGGVLRKLSY